MLTDNKRLDKRIISKTEDGDITVQLSSAVKNNIKFVLRPYQIEALTAFNYYINNQKLREKPTQLLFHMATGSGKTLIMASAILELYQQEYRNFIFFVNTDTIIRKTKANFLDKQSSKYLFKNKLNINGTSIKINSVNNFESTNQKDINILFSTIQGLHTKLNSPKENSITFDDFNDKKIVLISDEAHHINALTKKKHSKAEQINVNTWENTVTRILKSNIENIMLEFTATLELSHSAVANKYAKKLIYDYSLVRFREDGYSKEVKTNQIDYKPIQRAVVAVIISQYKKKIFASNGIIVKPVILFKSKTTKESALIETAFLNEIKNLTVVKLEKLTQLDNDILNKAINYFKVNLKMSSQNIIDEIKEDFSEDKIISVNSKNDTEEKQIIINSLEDHNNEYRAVFAVDKLNEGWDVLNLYDIVRLYDTRDAKANKPGKTTIAEAQLIGRGARYYPFKIEESQEIDKRKYDNDIDNQMRFCETLHYHCSHNPRYINELNSALREIGLFPEEKITVDLILKDSFKNTSLYKSGFIFLNKKVKNNPKKLFEYQEPKIVKKHTYTIRANKSKSTILLDNDSVKQNKIQTNSIQEHYFSNWDKNLIKKGLNKIPFYRFSDIKKYFPSVPSMDYFVTDKNYFGGIIVSVEGLQKDIKDLSTEQKLDIVIKIASQIVDGISVNFSDYRGTKSFYREPLRKYFKDKKLSFSVNSNTSETGKPTMRNDIDPEYYTDLNKADWYVYKENYGSSEEKFLVKYFHNNLENLKTKFKDIYLLRNERFFKLFRFSDGKATEPDFVLFMNDKFADKESNKEVIYQLFIEPKGNHLLIEDNWKEQFLTEIETEAIIELYEDKSYKLIGMPFYNKKKEDIFKQRLEQICKMTL